MLKNKEHWWYSIVWIGFMVLFTYTPVMKSLLMLNDDTGSAYVNHQYCGISVLVNFGLLFMVLMDYVGANKRIGPKILFLTVFGCVLVFVMFFHLKMQVEKTYIQYYWPISSRGLVCFLHITFLAVVLWIKAMSLDESLSNMDFDEEPLQVVKSSFS